MGKAAFDPNAPFEAVDEKPAFDPNKPFEPVEAEAVPTPQPRPIAAGPSIAPSAAPVPLRPEGGGTEGEPLVGAVPVPRPRPTMPFTPGPTQPAPPVAPLEDVPFRAKMKGYTEDEEGNVVPAPGLTGMLTGPQAYEQQFGKPAR